MHYEPLEIIIEWKGRELWLTMEGALSDEQIPSFREKMFTFLNDGVRIFVLDMERISFIGEGMVLFFLEMLNSIKSKGGELKLVFKNEALTTAFKKYRSIFEIFPDSSLVEKKGIKRILSDAKSLLVKKTGIRISRPIALLLLFTLGGWFITLLFIIYLQNRQIKEQQSEIYRLLQWEAKSKIEIERLTSRLKPLEQLGIVTDSGTTK
ncbi:MAG: STAS domain-containing protein [Chitinispirillaceae bacterium]|nr:STAS domain-containing protein [Chitinispirillaceae bacterium]